MTSAAPVRPLDELLCFAVYSVGHAFNAVYRPHLKELGLTYPQYLVMTVLWSRDDRTVGELGRELELESSTLTPLLKRLESMGLVERRRSTTDERQVCVSLQPAGHELRGRAADLPDCIAAATGLSPDDLQRLCDELGALRTNLLAAADD